jgi:phosphotransferase system enzyme I (PtsP)
MPRVDFVSVGSNDLMQYFFAADRNNTLVADRYDALSVAPLRALGAIAEAARRHERPLSLCGEMAGRPLEAMTLIGLGYRSISMSPASIGPVKSMVLSLDARALERWLDEHMQAGSGSLREGLQRFAEEQGVEIKGHPGPGLVPAADDCFDGDCEFGKQTHQGKRLRLSCA